LARDSEAEDKVNIRAWFERAGTIVALYLDDDDMSSDSKSEDFVAKLARKTQEWGISPVSRSTMRVSNAE
jgi:hypothetical protein